MHLFGAKFQFAFLQVEVETRETVQLLTTPLHKPISDFHTPCSEVRLDNGLLLGWLTVSIVTAQHRDRVCPILTALWGPRILTAEVLRYDEYGNCLQKLFNRGRNGYNVSLF